MDTRGNSYTACEPGVMTVMELNHIHLSPRTTACLGMLYFDIPQPCLTCNNNNNIIIQVNTPSFYLSVPEITTQNACTRMLQGWIPFRPSLKVDLFHETNLISIQVHPNDISSTVYSDIKINQSDSIHFHDIQWFQMLTSENKFQ